MAELTVAQLDAQSDANNEAVQARNKQTEESEPQIEVLGPLTDEEQRIEEDMQALNDTPQLMVPEEVASEEAFFTAGLSGHPNPVEQYSKIKNDLHETGTSEDVLSVRAKLAKELNTIEDEALFELIHNSPEMSAMQKSDRVRDHLLTRTAPPEVHMQEEFAIQYGASKEYVDPETQASHDSIMQNISDRMDHGMDQNKIDELVAMDVQLGDNEGNNGMAGAVTDMLATAIPGNIGGSWYKIIKQVLPEAASKWHILAPGEALAAVKDHLIALPPKEKQQFVRDMLKAVENSSGHLKSNDFIKYMIIHEFTKPLTDPNHGEGVDWDRVIENVSGVLDLAFAGQILRGGYRVLKSFAKSSPAHTVATVAREDASSMLANGLLSPEFAKALGTTQEEILNAAILPTAMNYSKQVMPADIVAQLEILQSNVSHIVGKTDMPSINLTAKEAADTVDSWKQVLTELDGATIYNNLIEVGIAHETEQLIAVGTYGRTATHGFASGVDAANTAKRLFGDTGWKIKQTNKVGELKDTKKLTGGKGEYFISMETRRNFDASDAGLFGKEDVHIGGWVAKYIADPSARFAKWISDAGLRAHDLGKGTSGDLNRLLRPFTSLGAQSQQKVISVIAEGSKAEKTFTYAELINDSNKFTKAEVVAYYSWRSANDALYLLNNERYANKLKTSGTQYLTNGTGGTKMLVNDQEVLGRVAQAYDPKSGKIIELGSAELKALRDSGAQIRRMNKSQMDGENGTRFVIVDKAAGTAVNQLPNQVLKYIPGYVPRYYDDMYFIERHRTVKIDGVVTDEISAVATAGHPKDALRYEQQMNGKTTDGSTFKARRGSEYTFDDRQARLLQVDEARGRMFFSSRGTELKNVEGLETITDPVSSVKRAIAATGRSVSHEPFVNSMKQRWINTYASGKTSMVADGTKGFPSEFNPKSAALGDATRMNEAKALHDYITLMSGATDPAQKAWKGWMMSLSEKFDGLFAKGNPGIHNIPDPISTGKKYAFNMFLALNPVRQAVLQTQQFLFIAPLAPKYAMTKMLRHYSGLQASYMVGPARSAAHNKIFNSAGAKAAGMEMDEYADMVAQFKQSGLRDTIDSHMFAADSAATMADAMSASRVGRTWNMIKKPFGAATDAAKKVGFDFGELNNLTNSWLIARHRYMKQNGKSWTNMTKRDNDNVSANARQYSLAMTEAGSLGYQRGWLGLATQFISIQHKAFAAVAPTFLAGNRAFTGMEKMQMGVGQLFFYGGAGLGVNKVYEAVKDQTGLNPTPEMDIAIQGGLVDWGLNKLFGAENITVSDDFAPVAGATATGESIIASLVSGNLPFWEVPLGASFQAGSRILNAVKTTQIAFQAPDMSNPEKLGIAVNAWLSTASGYNNYLKGRAMMRLGYHVNNSGDPVLQASFEDAVAKMGGFRSRDIKDFYDLDQDQPGKMTGAAGDRNDTMADIAKTYYKNMTTLVSQYIVDPATTLDEMQQQRLQAAIGVEASMLAALDPDEYEAVILHFRRLINKGVRSKSDTLINTIVNTAINGQYGTEAEAMVNRLRNSNIIKNEDDARMVQELFDYITEEDK